MSLTSFNNRYFSHWRHYRTRLAKVRPWLSDPPPGGASYLIPARLRITLVAADGDFALDRSFPVDDETLHVITLFLGPVARLDVVVWAPPFVTPRKI